MDFDLKSWSETNGFVWSPYSRRDGKPDGDLVCQQGLISKADDGLVAIVSDAVDDDLEALARVSAKRSKLGSGVYAFEFDPAQLNTVSAFMRPWRDQPDIEIWE